MSSIKMYPVPECHDLDCVCVVCQAREPLTDALYQIEQLVKSDAAHIHDKVSRIIYDIPCAKRFRIS
jgi:hypothetical protein